MMTVCMVGVMYSIKQWMIDKIMAKNKKYADKLVCFIEKELRKI